MYGLVAIAFCLLLGFSIADQGWTAVLWVPAGFAFGVWVTAQILLPIILGLPRAISLVVKGQMRSGVFGAIVLTPVIWLVSLGAAAFLWPAAAEYLCSNVSLDLGCGLGMIAIILSPLSKKCRADFRRDFHAAYRRFYTEEARSKWQKQVEAAVTIASNLYLHTIPGADDPWGIGPAALQFTLPDSRFRYLVFCLSALMTACAPEGGQDNLESVFDEALSLLLTWAIKEKPQEFFGGPKNPRDARRSGTTELQWLLSLWSKYAIFERTDESMEGLALICYMIHAAESNVPLGEADAQRLAKLGLKIASLLPTMRGAFFDLPIHPALEGLT
jgi:hypothetical protein